MSRKRVVLLARPGPARERTQAAIVQADAEVAICLDPSQATVAEVRGVLPDAVLVVLDSVVEQVLEQFDDVLGDPGILAIFEDGEAASRREGWEIARWARHLNAKLYGHGDVLPRVASEPAASVPVAVSEADRRFSEELRELQERVEALVQEGPVELPFQRSRLEGAVVVVAGVGGPDAVRQLLAALPTDFPRPLVLRQRIDGGQYDKLVRQMQRASPLRVVLAQAGDTLEAGVVHVLPDGLDLVAAPAGLVLASVAGEPRFAELPAGDSGLLLLSGADPQLVDRAITLNFAGGLALGQSSDNCFDPAASNALVARGGEALSISKLPHRLMQRWPHRGSP
jgi:chemosensory pili system protein ChpB (putative protein-glutamate methylesterase)